MPSRGMFYLYLGLLNVGVVYAVIVAAVAANTYARFRAERSVRCPEAGGTETVRLAAARATIGYLWGYSHVEVARCSRWSRDRRDCAQRCLRNAVVDQPQD